MISPFDHMGLAFWLLILIPTAPGLLAIALLVSDWMQHAAKDG